MAFSQSIRKGQIALVCQLCENEPKIKWKCLQCKLMLCQRCRDKVHPKFPSASDHTIIDIKETRTQEEESELNLDFSTLKCPVHKDSRDSSLSPVKKTTLSATAKEFVPNFVTQNQTAYSLSASAAECVPRQPAYPVFSQNNLFEDFQRLAKIGPHEVSKAGPSQSVEVITRSFSNTLYEMTIQPGSVEDAMRPIVEMLKNCPEDSAVHSIIDILFEQSVLEPNFRYTGAKVVQYLSNALKNIPTFTDFRNNFLTRCKEEYVKKEELISHPASVSRLCGFTMFMGELFLNLEVEKEGVKQKKAVIRFVIRNLLLVLLQHPTDETVKCATQLLKLAGAAIEDTAHLHAKPEEGSYNEVFTLLSQLSSNQHLNKTSNLLINSVLTLKSNNWGRRESVSSQPNTSSQYSQSFTNEPIFYNSQGQPITREEAGFNDYNTYLMAEEEAAEEYARWEAGELDDGQYYESWSAFPENYDYQQIESYDDNNFMDDEMEAAYEEFLKSQVQGRHHH